jgi:hypothetical protein
MAERTHIGGETRENRPKTMAHTLIAKPVGRAFELSQGGRPMGHNHERNLQDPDPSDGSNEDDEDDEAPETPLDEPQPTPVDDPPAEPNQVPYVVGEERQGNFDES